MNILLFNGINGLTTGKIKTSKELIGNSNKTLLILNDYCVLT